MSYTINTNINSLNAQRNAGMNGSSLSTAMQRLSSGLRINSAKDDAAGLAIATRMDAQYRGMPWHESVGDQQMLEVQHSDRLRLPYQRQAQHRGAEPQP